jgi:hypothetical protein
LQGDLETAAREQANASSAFDREEKKLQKEKRAAEEEYKTVEEKSRVVVRYLESGKDKDLERCEADLERKDSDMRQV